MQKFSVETGIVIPMDRPNVDTDAIIPKQFLKSIKRTGFGPNLFDEWRYLDHGEPGQDCSQRPINPDFELNQPRYKGGTILLARENFGCGSLANSSYVLAMLQLALDKSISGEFDAIVTAPVHKGVINDAGHSFSGHTEFFADGAGVAKVVMMLATGDLRVALATTHLPLAAVSDAITRDSLQQILHITNDSLKRQCRPQWRHLYPKS